MNSTQLGNAIRGKATAMGADLVGFAALAPAAAYIHEEYGPYCAGFPAAVSVAVLFPREIVQLQLEGTTRAYTYFYHAINRQLDAISLALSSLLQNAGYRACPVPASDYRESRRAERLQYRVAAESPESLPAFTTELYGLFSHRLAAALAGLGWVGKNCSIIHPAAGPRLRLATVLTDAPLPPARPLESRCGSCTRCRDACPCGALRGVAFAAGQTIHERIDRECCIAHMGKIEAAFGQSACALCLAACPWGSGAGGALQQ